jgi:hypothetical protein
VEKDRPLRVPQVSDRETDVALDGVEDLHARSEVGFGLGAADHGSGSSAIMVTLGPGQRRRLTTCST